MAADPAAHVNVAVGGAGTRGIDVEADSGFAFLAVAASAAGDVEGDGDNVAFLDELDVASGLDDFAGDFMSEDESRGGGGAAADHVLVGAADVGGDDFEDDAVLDFLFACRVEEFGEVDGLDFDFAGLDVGDAAVGRWHGGSFCWDVVRGEVWRARARTASHFFGDSAAGRVAGSFGAGEGDCGSGIADDGNVAGG